MADVAQDPVQQLERPHSSTAVKSYLEGATLEAEILISPYMIGMLRMHTIKTDRKHCLIAGGADFDW